MAPLKKCQCPGLESRWVVPAFLALAGCPYERPGLVTVFDAASLILTLWDMHNRVSSRCLWFQAVAALSLASHTHTHTLCCHRTVWVSLSRMAFDTRVASHDLLRPSCACLFLNFICRAPLIHDMGVAVHDGVALYRSWR
jgi:hypothetical protein